MEANARFCAACGCDTTLKKPDPAEKLCAACGAVLEDGVKFCAVCGTPCAQSAAPAEKKPPEAKAGRTPKTPKTPKDKKSGGKAAAKALKILRTALPVLLAVIVIAGLAAGFVLARKHFEPAKSGSEERSDVVYTNGLAVTLKYIGAELEKSGAAQLKLTVQNTTGSVMSDMALNISLPYGLEAPGGKTALTADTLAPGGSRTYALQVRRADMLDAYFGKIVLVLAATAVIAAAVIFLYALCCGKSLKAAKRVVAAVLACALLLPCVAMSVKAAQSESVLLYGDDGAAIGVKTSVTESRSFALGKGSAGKLSFTASYAMVEKLTLDAETSGDTLRLSWNAISGASRYKVFEADETLDFYELGETADSFYELPAPAFGALRYYRVLAETEIGELRSEDARVLTGENGIFVDGDCDMLSNALEKLFGTSASLEDTDGDGISDYDEITQTFTDPTVYDTNGDGTGDGEEDMDGDGLTNIEELLYGTQPGDPDSDGDGLTDGEELKNTMTDPLLYDTDSDGLSDGAEIRLATDPRSADSNGDGVSDADTELTITAETESGAAVSASDKGEQLTVTQVTDISSQTSIAGLDYVVSPVVCVETAETTSGFVTLPVIGDAADEDKIVIAVYNSADNDFRIIEDAELSSDGGSITAPVTDTYYQSSQSTADNGEQTATRRSYYVAFYVKNWHMRFEAPLSPDRNASGLAYFDVEFVIDESGSMEDSSKSNPNDPERYRVAAAKNFTYGLQVGDRAAVVGFSEGARRKNNLTENMDEVRASIDSIVGNAGGTALYSGINNAIEELLTVEDPGRGRFIIALTDGEDSSANDTAYDEIITQCVYSGIPIYTIGLGSSVNTSLLSRLANSTNGAYFHIRTADDLPQVFNRIENTAFFGDDTDGDGLADAVEEYGLRDGMGSVYMTDPAKRFTDDDDLTDGEEAGNVMYTAIDPDGTTVSYYIMLTDPTKADTDGDGVDDLDELVMGTLPWCADTDFDGLSDGLELSIGYDPLMANYDGDAFNDYEEYYNGVQWGEIFDLLEQFPKRSSGDLLLNALIAVTGNMDPYSYDLSTYEKARAMLDGLLLGDFGESLAEYGVIRHELTDSLFYLIGGVILDFIPGGDIVGAVRDALANVIQGDLAGALLSIGAVIPGGGDVVNVVRKICDFLGKAYDGYTGAIEYAGKVTINQVATAPAFMFLLLRIIRLVEDKTGIEMSSGELEALVRAQAENGVSGLTKDNMRNWEAFLNYGDGYEYYKASDAVESIDTIQLSVSNTALPITLTQSVRAAFNAVPGGQFTEEPEGTVYSLVRAIDLECTEYQNAETLDRALRDSVDRAADYADANRPDFTRRLIVAITDSVVSRDAFNTLKDLYGYAEERGVQLEYYIYLTTDDSDYTDIAATAGEKSKDKAIMIVPGIAGSELVAGEDFTGFSLATVNEGDIVWLPIDTQKALVSLMTKDKETIPVILSDAINSFNMLQMDSSGSSIYKLRAKTVSESDSSVGALGSGTAMYKGLLSEFGDEYDVIFYSYDWRYSVEKSAREMERFIDQRGYESVTFVCHSMGGIVTSCYLANSEENVEKTEKVISVATPYGGSPKALFTLQTGKFMDVSAIDYVFKTMAQNIGSVYELLTYDGAIGANGAYVTDLNSDPTGTLDAAAMDALFGNSFNAKLYNSAKNTQNRLYSTGEHIMNSDKVDSYIIAGYNVPTITRIYMEDGEPVQIGKSAAGDGTVPLVSAAYTNGQLFDKPLYFVNGDGEVDHTALFADSDVIGLVCGIIRKGHELSGSDYNGARISTSINLDSLTGEAKSDAVSDSDKAVYSLIGPIYDTIVAYCPVTLSLFDDSHELLGYVSSDGIFAKARYAAFFELMDHGETKQVIVPDGCTVEITGDEEGTMDLVVSSMRSGGALTRRAMFENIAVSPGMSAAVGIAAHKDATVSIDSDGDGKEDKKLTEADAQVTSYDTGDAEEGGTNAKLYVLLGIAALIVIGSAVSLLVITLGYRKKLKRLAA